MKTKNSWLKIIIVLAVAFVVAALLHGLIRQEWFSGDALKVAFLAVVLGFVILTWDEQGFFFALGNAVILAAMVAVAGKSPPASPILKGIYTLIYFTLFGGLMFLGDWVSRRILVLRAVVSFAGGIIAGVIMIFLFPLIVPARWGLTSFLLNLQGSAGYRDATNLIYVIETTGGAAIALLVARLIGGTKKDSD